MKRSPAHKVAFSGPRIVQRLDPNTENVNGLALGFECKNKASFPIVIEVASLETRVKDKVPEDQELRSRKIAVEPDGDFFYQDNFIDVSALIDEGPEKLFGYVSFEAVYGREDRDKRWSLSREFELEIDVDDGKVRNVQYFDVTYD